MKLLGECVPLGGEMARNEPLPAEAERVTDDPDGSAVSKGHPAGGGGGGAVSDVVGAGAPLPGSTGGAV